MTCGDTAKGEKRLETVIDFEPEKFKPTWDMVAHKMLNLDIDSILSTLYADVFDIPTEVILRCAIYRSAIDAFAETDMAGAVWHWDFCLAYPPVDEARFYAARNSKICIASTARWNTWDAGKSGKFLRVHIGDFSIFEPKWRKEQI